MSISESKINELRSAVTAKEILEEFGRPVYGSRNISCLLHSPDKNPSMSVHEDGVYCHTCGKRMDTIDLVRHYVKCDFFTALDWIADRVSLPRVEQDPEAEKVYLYRKSISATLEEVYHDSLKEPEQALAYLESRGISREVTKGLVGFLDMNYRCEDIVPARNAGLFSRPNGTHHGFFLFHGRVIIPVYHNGQIVDLFGRKLDSVKSDTRPRVIYCTTPEPPALPMPKGLWNLNECRGENELIICEGIIDALTLISRGYHGVVAGFGTQSFTTPRLDLLVAHKSTSVTLWFDKDPEKDGKRAGMEAMYSVGSKLWMAGKEVFIQEFPVVKGDGKEDINSYFQLKEPPALPAPREFIDFALDRVPLQGTMAAKLAALHPIIDMVAAQDKALWTGLAARIDKRVPGFGAASLVKKIQAKSAPGGKGKIKFMPKKIAMQMMESSHMFSNGKTIYRYQDGVYKALPDEIIDQEIIAILGEAVQASQLDAVRKILVAETYQDVDQINIPGKLNLYNGVLDTKTGEFCPHSSTLYSTVQTAVDYDPKAQCPKWLDFIAEVLPDADSRLLLQEAFGLALTTDCSYHKGFFFYGDGANGKSVVLDVAEAMVGKHNTSNVEINDLPERFRLIELMNKLLNIASEIPASGVIHDQKFKQVLDGSAISADRKHIAAAKFRPVATWFISANRLPQTKDRSFGYYRRLMIIVFPVAIPEDKQIRSLAEKLIEAEISGIMTWALQGYKRLKNQGQFTVCETSVEALQSYREDSDHTIAFSREFLTEGPGQGTYLADIMPVYQEWTKLMGFKALNSNNLRDSLARQLKFTIKSHSRKPYLKGIGLAASDWVKTGSASKM